MKKVFLAVSLTAISLGVSAQLKVASNGKVGLGTLSPHTVYPVTVQQNTNNYGDGAMLVRSVDLNSSFYIGQYNANAHLGSTTDVLAFYHWYTSYQKVYAQSYITASDRKIKDNIQSMENGIDYIMKLRSVSYNLKEDLEKGINKKVYGFISQEVQEILPELASEQMDILCLDYQQIIPFLVRGMQEQQNQINELKKLAFNIAESAGYEITNNDLKPAAVLYQNNPNPFAENTTIRYELPETFSSASIMIFNMNGAMLQSYPIGQKDEHKMIIEGHELKPGMYLYTLIVDGVEIDTKKMILSK